MINTNSFGILSKNYGRTYNSNRFVGRFWWRICRQRLLSSHASPVQFFCTFLRWISAFRCWGLWNYGPCSRRPTNRSWARLASFLYSIQQTPWLIGYSQDSGEMLYLQPSRYWKHARNQRDKLWKTYRHIRQAFGWLCKQEYHFVVFPTDPA